VRDGKLQITAQFQEREGMVAWNNFGLGDKVLVEIEVGTFDERIISALSASVSEIGDESVEVTFGDVFNDIATDLSRAANYGQVTAANLPTFTARATSAKPEGPTSTSIGTEVQGLSNRAVANWEGNDATSVSQYEAIIFREDQVLSGGNFISIAYDIYNVSRSGNIGTIITTIPHNLSAGDLINIYDTPNGEFDDLVVIVTGVVNSTKFTFDSAGPDYSESSATGYVTLVVESHSQFVDSSRKSVAIENLAAPGREYSFTVVPYALNGGRGIPSAPVAFTASSDPQVLFNGAIRSTNYVSNTSGWTIEADGNAEFNDVIIRNGAFVQGTFTSPLIRTANTFPRVELSSSGIIAYNSLGDAKTTISSTTGTITSVNGSFSGSITASTVSGTTITGGSISIGDNFSVTNSGVLTASGATITGNITANALTANVTITTPNISGGQIYGTTLNINDAFIVDENGGLVATDAAITGEIVATTGYIGGWQIDATGRLISSAVNPADRMIFSPSENSGKGAIAAAGILMATLFQNS
jgi:hypothetical protein